MTLSFPLTPEAEQALRAHALREDKTLEEVTQEALVQMLLADLQNRPVPQSLDALAPRLPLPPGQTALGLLVGTWPGDETDRELQAALKAMG